MRPYRFKIDFVSNPISGSATWFFVLTLKFIFTPIFEIKIYEKNPWQQKNFNFEARFSLINKHLQSRQLFIERFFAILAATFQPQEYDESILPKAKKIGQKTLESDLALTVRRIFWGFKN